MCDCNNKDNKSQLSNDIDVPNYALTGFNPESQHIQSLQSTTPEDVLALEIKGCVSAGIENGKICFNLPYLGKQCLKPPFPLPDAKEEISACFQTCSKLGIPSGAQICLYVNNTKL